MYTNVDYRVIEIARVLVKRLLDNEEEILITYGDLAKQLPFKINPRSLSNPLGTLSEICQYRDMPLISAMVVNKAHNRPGAGFFEYFFQGKPEDEWDKIFFKELQRIKKYKHWDKLLKNLGIEA
jgi:hypothetical protein